MKTTFNVIFSSALIACFATIGLRTQGATITVTSTADSGTGSLRAALANASNGDSIDASGVSGAILLTSGQLLIDKDLNIRGPGPANLAITRATGAPLDRIFIIVSNHVVRIESLAITNGNVGGQLGGGILNQRSTLTLSNCLISGNYAAGGGGVYNDTQAQGFGPSALSVIACTFSDNFAVETGGGVFNNGEGNTNATLTVTGSTFSHNSAGEGGAIATTFGTIGNATVILTSSTLSSNSANDGGGIFIAGPVPPIDDDNVTIPPLFIIASTFNGNSSSNGDSIYSTGPAGVIESTILNAGSSGTNIAGPTAGFASGGYNLSSDSSGWFATSPTDQTNTPPLLGLLQDNGGLTLTHAPLCGSPAIDKGRNRSALATDQRGAPRTVDIAGIANAPFGDGTDVGAVESPIWVFTVQNTADSGTGSLRAAISNANASPGIDEIEFTPSAYGTITLTSGELLITDCLLLNGPGATNAAINGNAASRVFHVSNSIVAAISGLTITKGSAAGAGYPDGFGGGILNDHSTLLLQNCNVSSNSAAQTGGIFNDGSSTKSAAMSIVNCTVSGNNSFGSGAGIRSDGTGGGSATLLVANSTISGNSTEVAGGGFYSLGHAALTLYNCTLSGNNGPHGSGIANLGTTLILGSTILNATGPDRFTNSIINNGSGSVVSLGYNLSSDDGGGFLNQSTDQTNTNPLLGPLQLNGGQTPTHALLCGSPAIDASTNFSTSATDQTGGARTFDDLGAANATGGDGTDIGAFELQQSCDQPPVALCTNVTVSADSNCVASASIDNGSYDPDAGDSITKVQTPPGPYDLGTNLVTLTVTDSHGASNSCQATVRVVDTTPPVIACPTNIVTTNDLGQCSAVVSFTATATDNCAMGSISSDPASGSTFSAGTNTVTVTAVDAAGNTNTCSFTVTVLDQEPPQVACFPAPNPSGKISPPGKNGSGLNPSGYYQVLAKDNCDPAPKIYIKDTGSTFIAGPFKDGDIVRLKHAGGAPSSVPGAAPVVAVINLKGNGLNIAKDASGNMTPDPAGCPMQVH